MFFFINIFCVFVESWLNDANFHFRPCKCNTYIEQTLKLHVVNKHKFNTLQYSTIPFLLPLDFIPHSAILVSATLT